MLLLVMFWMLLFSFDLILWVSVLFLFFWNTSRFLVLLYCSLRVVVDFSPFNPKSCSFHLLLGSRCCCWFGCFFVWWLLLGLKA